jgi:hypothetical protein
MARRVSFPIALAIALFAASSQAQNFEVLDEQLAGGEGYTVVRVWGTHHDIGFAIGAAFADEIATTCDEVRGVATDYDSLRTAMGYVTWVPAGIDQEFQGLADGVKSVRPGAAVDAVDMQVLNTYGDWAYPPACRSHSCWGSRVAAPYSTISTRRLDFGSPFAAMHHHVIYAVEPTEETGRWVNLAWPGFVSVVTGVNENGTVVSLHDFNSTVTGQPGVVPRSMATRNLLSSVPSTPVSGHLSWAQQQLGTQNIATGTFINFYAPDGHGGVFSCVAGQSCSGPRTPQSDYLGGEVLITTNSQTDGHTTPYGAEYLDAYYQQPAKKTPETHFDVMVAEELHMLTVGYRGPGDMRLLAHGRTSNGWTPRIDIEWSTLFPAAASDAGVEASVPEDAASSVDGEADVIAPVVDANGTETGGESDAASQGSPPANGGEAGSDDDACGCSTPGRPAESGWLLWMSLGIAVVCRKRAIDPSTNRFPPANPQAD